MTRRKEARRPAPRSESSFATPAPLRDTRHQDFAAVVFLILCVAVFLAPLIFERKVPAAPDTQAWRGSAEAMIRYRAETGQEPLWAPGLFSGMPGYLVNVRVAVPSLDTVLNAVGKAVSWPAAYLLFGALCLYALVRRWGVRPTAAAFAALTFALTPYLRSLIEAGHNTKLKAIAFIPALLLGTDFVFEKRNVLSVLLLALALSLELRANHAQIAYYAVILLLVYGAALVVLRARAGRGREALAAVGLAAAAVVLAGLLVAQPYANIREYAHYSIRGGGAGAGLSKEYATSWSLPPREWVTLLVPAWYGLRDAMYWGEMPFTSSSIYLGLLPIVLAVAALFIARGARTAALTAVTAIAAVLAVGKYLGGLNDVFLGALPYYNKFRVPSMALVLTEVTVAALAALGMESLLRRAESTKEAGALSDRTAKILRTAVIASAALLLVILLGRSGLHDYMLRYGLSKPEDVQRFQQSDLALLKSARWDLLYSGLVRFGAGALLLFSAMWLVARRRIPAWTGGLLFLAILVADLAIVDRSFLKNLESSARAEQPFARTATDDFLEKDPSVFRVLPMGGLFGDNRWAFHHESVGGYHAAKMRTYQRLLEATVYGSQDPSAPAMRNALRMLNVKYLVVPGLLPGGMPEAFRDPSGRLVTYELPGALPRAWLVETVTVAPSEDAVLARIGGASFDPEREAVIIGSAPAGLGAGPVSGGASIVRRDLHSLELQVEASRPALLVVSEMDYPPDWRAFVDGAPAEIRAADLVLRSVVVPAGSHRVLFRLTAPTYRASVRVARGAMAVLVAGFVFEGLRFLRRRRGAGGAG